jgi:DNA recombination protein RmuC
MDNLTGLVLFSCGLIIGAAITYFLLQRKKSDDDNDKSLSDVKEIVKDLSNQISLKEGKDEERYDLINKLTAAFTGGTKKQGIAGEILLLNILQQSGFREGKDFEVQKKYDDEIDGEFKKKYPDIILHLPDDRDLVIDSKISLSAWQDYCKADDETTKIDAHKRHIQSIRTHIKKLSEANYQKIYEIKTLDAVVMFMPYESAFDSMLDKVEEVILEANKFKIILASPSTLISVLKIIDNMWSINERNRNADSIASTALEIYAQVEKVYSAFENAGHELNKSMGSIETAKSRLRDGKGSLVSRVKKMLKLGGLKPDKEIPDFEENEVTKIKKIK